MWTRGGKIESDWLDSPEPQVPRAELGHSSEEVVEAFDRVEGGSECA
jgi:hypothetical protein